jgi:rhodanese-related sulfurtransferase
MPHPSQITVAQLSRLIGLPGTPGLVDVRSVDEFESDSRLIPTASLRSFAETRDWASRYVGQSVVVYCRQGTTLSQGVAAQLRHHGIAAQSLEGGYEAWRESGEILLRAARIPARDATGCTLWVTRARPKIVRVACPWLIRRFVDPAAEFLYVAPSEVHAVAKRFNATPFDTDNAFWHDRGELCTFDVMLDEFGLDTRVLRNLAVIVRGADTGRLDLAPQCAGFLAASLGYSRMYRDDLAQLDAAMSLYDALFRWCRDAGDETHG